MSEAALKPLRFGSRAKAPGSEAALKPRGSERPWPPPDAGLGSTPGTMPIRDSSFAPNGLVPWRRGSGAVPFSGAQGGQAYLGKRPHVCRLRCVRIAFGAVFVRASPAGEECLRHMLQIQAMKVGSPCPQRQACLLQAGHDAVCEVANTLAAGNVPGGRQTFRGGGRAASRRGLRLGAGLGAIGRRRLLFLQTGYRRSGRPFGQPFAFFALCLSLAYILLPPRCSAAGLVRQHYRCCGACTPYSRYHRTNRLKSSS